MKSIPEVRASAHPESSYSITEFANATPTPNSITRKRPLRRYHALGPSTHDMSHGQLDSRRLKWLGTRVVTSKRSDQIKTSTQLPELRGNNGLLSKPMTTLFPPQKTPMRSRLTLAVVTCVREHCAHFGCNRSDCAVLQSPIQSRNWF